LPKGKKKPRAAGGGTDSRTRNGAKKGKGKQPPGVPPGEKNWLGGRDPSPCGNDQPGKRELRNPLPFHSNDKKRGKQIGGDNRFLGSASRVRKGETTPSVKGLKITGGKGGRRPKGKIPMPSKKKGVELAVCPLTRGGEKR